MRIWNKKDIPLDTLKTKFLSGFTLGDLAKENNCSLITIKRKLRSFGVDTSIYNNSDLAKDKHREKVCVKTKILTKNFLQKKLIQENFDTKTLSEQLDIHYSVIRAKAQAFGIKKSKDQVVGAWQARYKERNGYLHPTQDPKHSFKYWKSLNKVKYVSKLKRKYFFKSIMELSYALYLDFNDINWDYETIRVPYIHHFTGKNGIYIIDFETDKEWIEVKPNNKMIPSDKRLYATRAAEKQNKKFRGLVKQESQVAWSLILSGYRAEYYSFVRRKIRRDRKQITYYFKNKEEMNAFNPSNFVVHHRKQIAPNVFKLVLRKKNAS